jgi:hypothetical protein
MSQYIVRNIHGLDFTCRATSKDLRYTRKRPLYTDEEDLVWIQTTWCRAFNTQQKRGEKPSITKILYQNGYSELKDDGLPIHDKALMMTEEVHLDMFQV